MIYLCGKDNTIICNEVYSHLFFSESPSQLHLQVGLRTLVDLLVRTANFVTVKVVRGAQLCHEHKPAVGIPTHVDGVTYALSREHGEGERVKQTAFVTVNSTVKIVGIEIPYIGKRAQTSPPIAHSFGNHVAKTLG